MDHLVLFTGEGLRRLLPVAEAMGLREDSVAALARSTVASRGPKPARELRQLGLKPDHAPGEATTEGLITTLAGVDLSAKRVGVQLYGTEPNERFMAFLHEAGAEADPVAPYIYASDDESDRVKSLLDKLAHGTVEVIAFTSRKQVQRLFRVAREAGGEQALTAVLAATRVAAVGPVVTEALTELGIRPGIAPETNYSMKPLVRALEARIGADE